MSKIAQYYREDAHTTGGLVTVDRTDLKDPYRKSLLALLYWLVYEKDGRDLVHRTRFEPSLLNDAVREAAIRKELKEAFSAFNVLGQAADSLVEAHLAAVRWTLENKAENMGNRDVQESLYMQHMAAVTWWMWEESAKDNFSLPW
jgi:hypothetical protein